MINIFMGQKLRGSLNQNPNRTWETMKIKGAGIFLVSKLYCFGISLWVVFSEVYSLIQDKINFNAVFLNYTEIFQGTLAIYGIAISILFKLKTKPLYHLIWWFPQLLIVNKVIYTYKSVAHQETIFDLSLLFRIGFNWGFKDAFDVYTMVQINIIAIIGIILLLIERERSSAKQNDQKQKTVSENGFAP